MCNPVPVAPPSTEAPIAVTVASSAKTPATDPAIVAAPESVSVASSIEIPYAYPLISVPERVRSSPELREDIPILPETPVPTSLEPKSLTSQPSVMTALSPMLMVFNWLWTVTELQSTKSRPTALGATRVGLSPIVLFSTTGPEYPPVLVP